MGKKEYGNNKVISFFALLGVIVNFVVSIMATRQDRKIMSIIFFIAAFYCLSKVDLKGKKKEYKMQQYLNKADYREYRVFGIFLLLLFLWLW